jgi:hypothetical protein
VCETGDALFFFTTSKSLGTLGASYNKIYRFHNSLLFTIKMIKSHVRTIVLATKEKAWDLVSENRIPTSNPSSISTSSKKVDFILANYLSSAREPHKYETTLTI